MKMLLPLLLLTSISAGAQTNSWKVTEPNWTRRHEDQFGEFVARIGDAVEKRKCRTVEKCMKSTTANPYINGDPAGLRYYSDCADLPYYLRTYFAWKNGLPFSVVSSVEARKPKADPKKVIKDVRYSPLGNYPTARKDIYNRRGSNGEITYPNAVKVLNSTITDQTSSATFRMMGSEDMDGLFADFYPVEISRDGIRPGTAIYDPNGHVAIVYKVTDDGRVFYIDAHPDNSLTSGMFTPKFVRSHPLQGAGFKNFRPLRLKNPKFDSAAGVYTGSGVEGFKNSELPLFSIDQFTGNEPHESGLWKKGKFVLNGQTFNFHDFVRMKLMQGEVHIDPLRDMAQLTEDICVSLKDRVPAVEGARTAGMDKQAHPERLPFNIYGTSGDWEEYSSPSRDARLKTSYVDLLNQTKANIQRYQKRDPILKYNGGNLAADLLAIYREKAMACEIEYTTSNGKTVRMNLEAARQRLYDMSFDPYHCIELRWGAKNPEELASCKDNSNKRAWYEQEKWLRYQSERTYEARMDFSLKELTGPKPSAGVSAPEENDVSAYLKSLQ